MGWCLNAYTRMVEPYINNYDKEKSEVKVFYIKIYRIKITLFILNKSS